MLNRRTPLLAIALAVLLAGGALPRQADAATTVWQFNTYRSSGYLTQDPYYTACTAAATMMMLNFTALSGGGGNGFRWKASRAKNVAGDSRDMTSVFAWARAHDTLAPAGRGSDPHGWRNALNYYGWGSTALGVSTRIYDDRTFRGFDEAVRAAVVAIARFHKPVGVLAWAGRHAQVVTGYRVVGANPATSTNFTVTHVYLSDPLASDGYVNRFVYIDTLRQGSLLIRLRPYSQTDSPYDDPYTPGVIASSTRTGRSEWFGRYVLILPIRNELP
ncbi:MAG TPA: hypothetical protein VFR93_10575 [Candidatus Limnocylindrales bacterium]|nr:hypothetical protein [Candidatus Limnocylindrales bacterium]